MPDFVQSLERGLAVIRAFDADHPQLTLSDVARATGLTRAAARRFLLTLVELGYVRTDGRLFSLRPRVLDLGYADLSSTPLPEVAQRPAQGGALAQREAVRRHAGFGLCGSTVQQRGGDEEGARAAGQGQLAKQVAHGGTPT